MTQIFSNDPVVPYKTTEINPLTTKAEIDGLLARWGIKKSAWDWDLENNRAVLNFQITETIDGKEVNVVVELKCPLIYQKPTKRNPKLTVNWRMSVRVLYWWLKSHLEYHYLSQSSKTAMFLPFIQTANGKTLEKRLIPQLGEIAQAQLMDNSAAVEPDTEKALKEYQFLKEKQLS
jgi:hypothetical protein